MFRAAQRQPAARLEALYKTNWLNYIWQFSKGRKLEIYLSFFLVTLMKLNFSNTVAITDCYNIKYQKIVQRQAKVTPTYVEYFDNSIASNQVIFPIFLRQKI